MISNFFSRRFRLQLESKKIILPKLSHQKEWAKRFAPQKEFLPQLGAWELLQQFVLPLTLEHGSRAHRKGIQLLRLDQSVQPSFESFRCNVERHCHWTLVECKDEMAPTEYFAMLSERKFPCVRQLRPAEGTLCNDKPDFWHEAIGHIAPLVDPTVSQFYQQCGRLFVQVSERKHNKKLKELEKLLWVLLEYGFVKEDSQWKAFGAAVTGSFVALNKWQGGYWAIHDFDPQRIIHSGLFDEGFSPRRDNQGRIVFYGFRSLQSLSDDLESLFESWYRS